VTSKIHKALQTLAQLTSTHTIYKKYNNCHKITSIWKYNTNSSKKLQEISAKLHALAQNYKHSHSFQQFAKKLQEFSAKLQAFAQNYKRKNFSKFVNKG
jgi:hypothetical protein